MTTEINREATFVLTSTEFNDIAINIIKLVQEKKEDPDWEKSN